MGKWLERLHETTAVNNPIPVKAALTKPTKESVQILLSPFVSAESRDSQFFSNPKLLDENSNDQLEKTVKASKQEVTKPTKGMHANQENSDCHAKRVALEWLELIQETNPDNIEHVINVATNRPETLKFMERRLDQLKKSQRNN